MKHSGFYNVDKVVDIYVKLIYVSSQTRLSHLYRFLNQFILKFLFNTTVTVRVIFLELPA